MTKSVSTSPPNRRNLRPWVTFVVLLAASLFGYWFWGISESTSKLRLEAQQSEADGDVVRTAELTDRFLVREPHDLEMLLRAIRMAVKRDQLNAAVEYLARLDELAVDPAQVELTADYQSTMNLAGEAFFQAGFVDPAEKCLGRCLESPHPTVIQVHTRLAFLLSCEGRRWESVPHLLELLRHSQVSIDQLLWLGNLQTVVGDDALLEAWGKRDPEGLGPRLGTAIRQLARHDSIQAAPQLIQLTTEYPNCVEVGIQLGKAAIELEQLDRPARDIQTLYRQTKHIFIRWHSIEAEQYDTHPDLWSLRGQWLLNGQDSRGAIRCFAEALRLNPDQPYANYQLALLLQRELQSSVAKKCAERAEELSQLFRTINLIYDNRRNIELMKQAAEQTESLGRLWEAWGWYRMILTVEPKADWAWQNSSRLRKRLDSESPGRVITGANPIKDLDLTPFPLPDWSRFSEIAPEVSRGAAGDAALIQFEDASRKVGLDFTYFNSPHKGAGERSFEFTGGGVGVLDFDADGWPDLYWTQGSQFPVPAGQSGQQRFLDRLNRNIQGERFVDVTNDCGILEDEFSQGLTVGDYDSDGFPDLYVANIGPNRFLRNNGDGTFSDVTQETGTAGHDWSTSCVLADANADSLPDLYVVNYLAGDDVFTRVCHDPDGSPRLCYPQVFPSAADQFYLNRGDGSFEEVSAQCGIEDSTGRGMGIVAADFEGTGRLNLFVANDTTANFYFRCNLSSAGDHLSFSEEGVSSGLAFDASGQALASMGIATADVDRDGRLDLFVTNFEREYNNLYLQSVPGLFTDSMAQSGIKDSGFLMLGFGAQFLDADLDGWSDLFVANGHIDDFTRQGIPYQMPPQFFRNLGGSSFREQSATTLGQYFEGKYLGRAVARLDWNRDGLEELAISHLGSSSILLTNRTQTNGKFLVLELRGVTSSRDAIGARISVQIGNQIQYYQLTAGDGYQASNERRLVIGLGDIGQVDEMSVSWPGGSRQSFENIASDTAWTIIENHPRLIHQPRK